MSIHFTNDLSRLRHRHPATQVVGVGDGFYRNYGKRFLETFLVLLSSMVTLPLVAILAVLVALDGGNPFYRQKRVGRNGVVFSIWKLRTMVPNADLRLAEYLAAHPEARREWENTQKLKRDPRVTSLGRFLRKTSLDELPQLWNVVRGDMSLVGPRPMMVEQRDLYPGTSYFSLRPGITGLWQISGRNECTFSERALFDTMYDSSVSFAKDTWILIRTIRTVMNCTGY